MGQSYGLAGQNKTLWLERTQEKGDAFDLLARDAGGKWQWVGRDKAGHPEAVVSAREGLHVFFKQGDHLIFNRDVPEGVYGPSVLAKEMGHTICGCVDPRPGQNGLVLVTWKEMAAPASAPASCPATSLAPRPADAPEAPTPTTRTATGPASQDSRRYLTAPSKAVRLTVYESDGDHWRPLGTIEGLPYSTDVKVFVAVHQTWVYVMISDTARHQNRLLALNDTQWRDVPLTAEWNAASLASDPVVAMQVVKDQLTILLRHGDEEGKSDRVYLAKTGDAAATFAWQVLTNQDKELAWPAGATMQAAAVNEQLAMLTSSGTQTPQLTMVDPDGRMVQQESLDILETKVEDEFSQRLLQYFLWGVLIAIFVPLFWVRPGTPPTPFALPEGTRTGNLFLRVLAGTMDLLPFFAMAMLVFPLPLMTYEEWQTAVQDQQVPANFSYCVVSASALYVLYAIAMELAFGATIGKMIFHLKVIGDQGKKPTLRAIALRNLVKIIEMLWPIYWPVLVLFPIFSRNRQRLGDMLARTAVVDATTLPKGAEDEKGPA